MDFLGVNAQLLGGFKYTLLIFFITLVAAIPLGLPIALGSMSRFKPLRWISSAFEWVIRGTPLMLQIMVVFYVPGLVFGTPFRSRIIAVIIAFIINYAAYFSEIYRGGIESIPVGQYEAGQVLGLAGGQAHPAGYGQRGNYARQGYFTRECYRSRRAYYVGSEYR